MRILVVEDEQKIANSIKQGLEQEGFAVDVSYSGDDGYDLASTENYDLLILDLMLPEMDGTQICKNLRSEKNDVPIIMLTAKSQTEDKVAGLNCGADDYLTKPFSFDELLARIKSLLRRPKSYLSNVLRCSDLELDTLKYKVYRDGKQIDLSKKEFALLEYLLRNKNTVLSKDNIMDHVWDYDADVLPNTVEVYIGYLRIKLENRFKNKPKLIHTKRGFGYVLKCPEDGANYV